MPYSPPRRFQHKSSSSRVSAALVSIYCRCCDSKSSLTTRLPRTEVKWGPAHRHEDAFIEQKPLTEGPRKAFSALAPFPDLRSAADTTVTGGQSLHKDTLGESAERLQAMHLPQDPAQEDVTLSQGCIKVTVSGFGHQGDRARLLHWF